MGRDYPRLEIEEFGRQLIESGDLDPIYIALDKVNWTHDQRDRWLVAYWCWYHAGVACYMSEHTGSAYWTLMMVAAKNAGAPPVGGRWPRGHERRHARGEQALNMVRGLRNQYKEPEEFVRFVSGPGGTSNTRQFSAVAGRVKVHNLFGPWIAFKVADMLERVCGVPVDFDKAAVFMFKDPVKACEMLFVRRQGLDPRVKPKLEFIIEPIVEHLRREFADLQAPPARDRAIDLQEIETVLCKWKSHMNGHYPLYNDIDEINSGLGPWLEVSSSAKEFAAAMPRRPRDV